MAVIRNAVFRLYILHAACSMCCYPTYSIWDHRLPRTREPFHRCLSLWIGSNSFNSTMDPGNYKISLLSCFFSNDISQTSIFLSSLKRLTPVSLIFHDNLYLGPPLLIPLLLYTSRNFFFYSLFTYLFFLKLFVLFFILSFSYSHDSVISFFAYSILEFFHILH